MALPLICRILCWFQEQEPWCPLGIPALYGTTAKSLSHLQSQPQVQTGVSTVGSGRELRKVLASAKIDPLRVTL